VFFDINFASFFLKVNNAFREELVPSLVGHFIGSVPKVGANPRKGAELEQSLHNRFIHPFGSSARKWCSSPEQKKENGRNFQDEAPAGENSVEGNF
jgi:hypothetical protein